MSKKKAGTNEFTPDEKVAILREIEVLGNVSKVAEKWGVSRQSIYNWQAQRSKLEDDMRIQ
jgi:transposase-like protein